MDSMTRPQILRAVTPRDDDLPTYLYWNAGTNQWGRFDEATRYPAPVEVSPPLPCTGADIEWVDDLPRDLDGHPYVGDLESGDPWRVTHCCAAFVSIDDGPLYCKSCYEEADLSNDTPARLDANWDPGNGPMRFHLPPS